MLRPLLFIFLLVLPTFAHAQEVAHQEAAVANPFYPHRIAVFSGFALIQGAVNEEGKTVPRAIPVIGLDYEYFFNHKWGIGLFNDLEIANYVIPFEENDVLKREYAFVTALVGLYEPIQGLTFFAGPGYEFETHKNFALIKVGLEVAKTFDDGWSAGFATSFDFKEVNSALSIGLTVVKGVGKPR